MITKEAISLGRQLRELKVKDAIGMLNPDDLVEVVREGVREFYGPDRANEILTRIGAKL